MATLWTRDIRKLLAGSSKAWLEGSLRAVPDLFVPAEHPPLRCPSLSHIVLLPALNVSARVLRRGQPFFSPPGP